MAVIQPVSIVLILSCFIAIEAFMFHAKKTKVKLNEVENKCAPGKFYKRGCKQCFCDEKGRAVCSRYDSNCKLVDKTPTSPDLIKTYSREELRKLPALTHQAADCNPGGWYRVDCNSCMCLANKNLLCNDLLCPSYDDVNRIKAKNQTGKPCTPENENHECIKCSCEKASLKCEATPNCVPTGGRRDFRETPPIDLKLLKSKKLSKACEPGMVYKEDCNRCYCQGDSTLRCTLMKCLKNTEVKRLKKLRLELEKEGL